MVYNVKILKETLNTTVHIPGSKYLANRALILASFSNSKSIINNLPNNEDIQVSIEGLKTLGSNFKEENNTVIVDPIINKHPIISQKNTIYTHHNGSFTRFITPFLTLSDTPIELIASEQMSKRPMKELIIALQSIGAKIISNDYFLPITINGPITNNELSIDSSKSSQFITGLMMLAPHLKKGLTIHLPNTPVSNSYIIMTKKIMESFKIKTNHNSNFIHIPHQNYQGQSINIEIDPVSASYFLLLAAITCSTITINNYPHVEEQKEAIFPFLLEKMGCQLIQSNNSLTIIGTNDLKAIDVDMSESPDIVPSLSVACMYSKGKSVLRNIGHLRYKESDRLTGCYDNLNKMGINTYIEGNDLHIHPTKEPQGTTIDPHDDHRMAMSFAISGLRTNHLSIKSPMCVNKTFPQFWNTLEQLGIQIEKSQ